MTERTEKQFKKRRALLLALVMCFALCGAANAAPGADGLTERAAAGANVFAFRLARELRGSLGGGNFLCSPYSVWLPLAALSNVTDESLLPALLESIGVSGMPPEALNAAASLLSDSLRTNAAGDDGESGTLQIANGIFVNKALTLDGEFVKTFADSYRGGAMSVDFTTSEGIRAVNDWASEHTNGKITNVVSEFPVHTVAAITNAIFFSDRWRSEFSASLTKEEIFYAPGGETKAPLMYKWEKIPYYEDETLQAAGLRFDGRASLFVFLPKDRDAEKLLAGLDAEYFKKIADGVESREGELFLPRWSSETGTMDVKGALETMGVPLFDAAKDSLGALIAEDLPIFISQAMQKAMIEVDEKGATAAAVTFMAAVPTSAPPEPEEPFVMRCDRPFVFVLSSTAKGNEQVLFVGLVERP
jgi:serpin B